MNEEDAYAGALVDADFAIIARRNSAGLCLGALPEGNIQLGSVSKTVAALALNFLESRNKLAESIPIEFSALSHHHYRGNDFEYEYSTLRHSRGLSGIQERLGLSVWNLINDVIFRNLGMTTGRSFGPPLINEGSGRISCSASDLETFLSAFVEQSQAIRPVDSWLSLGVSQFVGAGGSPFSTEFARLSIFENRLVTYQGGRTSRTRLCMLTSPDAGIGVITGGRPFGHDVIRAAYRLLKIELDATPATNQPGLRSFIENLTALSSDQIHDDTVHFKRRSWANLSTLIAARNHGRVITTDIDEDQMTLTSESGKFPFKVETLKHLETRVYSAMWPMVRSATKVNQLGKTQLWISGPPARFTGHKGR